MVAAVTAAGASSRMGEPKALLAWGDGTVLSTILATLGRAGITESTVVAGAYSDAIAAEATRVGTSAILNEDWQRGRFSSVRIAAKWAQQRSATLLLWPVDCPGVGEDTIRLLMQQARANPQANVVPRFSDRGGHPVVLGPATIDAIVNAGDDANLRDFLQSDSATRVDVQVADHAVVENINRPDDYETAKRERARGS